MLLLDSTQIHPRVDGIRQKEQRRRPCFTGEGNEQALFCLRLALVGRRLRQCPTYSFRPNESGWQCADSGEAVGSTSLGYRAALDLLPAVWLLEAFKSVV